MLAYITIVNPFYFSAVLYIVGLVSMIVWAESTSQSNSLETKKFFLAIAAFYLSLMFMNAAGKIDACATTVAYGDRLESGVLYTRLAWVAVPDIAEEEHVLVVGFGKGGTRSLRVAGAEPPEHFALIEGKPSAVSPGAE